MDQKTLEATQARAKAAIKYVEEAAKVPTTEERIAALESRVAALEEAALAPNDDITALGERIEALEAKAKTGNKQGYPREGVRWDGKVRLLAKDYGYTAAEIDDMQESMDGYFLSLVGTSKARVSSDWQLNARTWIKNTAKREGRERPTMAQRKAQGQSEHQDSPAPESDHTRAAVEALAGVLLANDIDPGRRALERHRMARQIRDAWPFDIDILKACNRHSTPHWDNMSLPMRLNAIELYRRRIQEEAANLPEPIGRERFAWPEI